MYIPLVNRRACSTPFILYNPRFTIQSYGGALFILEAARRVRVKIQPVGRLRDVGPFCHVDLVVKADADVLRSVVSEVYMDPNCNKNLRDTIESCLFTSSAFRSQNTLFVAFSALGAAN